MIIGSSHQYGLDVHQSGGAFITEKEVIPTDDTKLNPQYEFVWMASGTATGVTGSSIGSVWMILSTGSYVQSLAYSNNNLTNTSVWGVV